MEQVISKKKDSFSAETREKVAALAQAHVKSSNETVSTSATSIVNQLS